MPFKKAQPKQAAVKMSIYGSPGSGKTFSTLLFAEGIAKRTGKRIAFVDTERGTDFYAMAVPERDPHPEAFDFDAIYTRSVSEVVREVKALKPAEYGIIVIDSISHLWDTAIASYTGKKTAIGSIPMHAWGPIKAPYKELMKFLIDSPFHVFFLGRQANIFEEDPDTGETKSAGVKMRAEGETQYEPHICLRMTPERTMKQGKRTIVHREQVIAAFAEKDRSGILAGKVIQFPTFDNVIAPLLGILHGEQGAMPSDDEAAAQDAEAQAKASREKAASSAALKEKYLARFTLAEDEAALKEIAKELAKEKAGFRTDDLTAVRSAYAQRDAILKVNPPKLNGHVKATEPAKEAPPQDNGVDEPPVHGDAYEGEPEPVGAS